MTSGATSGSVLDRFLRVKGSSGVSAASSSFSISSDGGRDGVTATLGAVDFLEGVAALFLVDGAEVVAPSRALAGTLGCLGPDFYPRIWSGSNSMRVPIHP